MRNGCGRAAAKSQRIRTTVGAGGTALGPRFAGVSPVLSAAPRILIVDDEANARNALLEILADEGYVVDSAVDGAAGCERLAAFRPDLVLTDVHMPRMDGLALLRHARACAGCPAVVLMSAHRHPETDAPFLYKPIDIDELLATVQRTLAARGGR